VILEVAILDVRLSDVKSFEIAFGEAQKIIEAMAGYVSHQLQNCIEKPNRYILLVTWDTLEDHTTGFRESEEYQKWRTLLHHFYEPFPVVEHYNCIFSNAR